MMVETEWKIGTVESCVEILKGLMFTKSLVDLILLQKYDSFY